MDGTGAAALRRLEIGGGQIEQADTWRLHLPPVKGRYADAQLDDYGPRQGRGARFAWRPGTTLRLRARFSHDAGQLVGTAGFGFWNAPFGDPTLRRPALPRVVWFFYASPANDLPFAPAPGHGWFAATMDATRPFALALAPLTPLFLLLHQVTAVRRRLWPWLQRQLGIQAALIPGGMTAWREYALEWRTDGVVFAVDGQPLLATAHAPRGALGFVCWLDNQYLVARPNGRLRWGVEAVTQPQWLALADMRLTENGRGRF